MKPIENKLIVFITVLVFFQIFIVTPLLPGFLSDINCWRVWAIHIHQHGLGNVYDSGSNYLPLYQYVLWFYSWLAGSEKAIAENTYYLRFISLAVDVAGIWLIYQWTERKYKFLILLLFATLNIAYVYNTLIWGQVDGILATLAFASVYFGYYKKPVLSILFMLLLLNFKLQGIIFLPVWLLLYACHVFEKPSWRIIVFPFLAAISLQLVIFIPFILAGSVSKILGVLTDYVGAMPYLSANARNFWNFIYPDSIAFFNLTDDNIWFAGMSYKTIGLILFFLSSGAALLILIIPIIKKIINKIPSIHPDKISLCLCAAIIAISFFYFNTEMHERYSHPAFIFILAYSLLTKDFIPFIIFSVATFLNLEVVLRWLQLKNYGTLIFDSKFISLLFAVTLVYLFIKLIIATKKDREPVLYNEG